LLKKFSYIIQIYKVYDVNQKFIENSVNFNIIILEKKIKSLKKNSKNFWNAKTNMP